MNTEKKSPVTGNMFSKLLLFIKCRISEHRLGIRSAIISRPLNLRTLASLLPFILGFYDFMNQNQQIKKIVFEKNIPTFGIPTELLNWETFRYFGDTKKHFLLGIEKIEWSKNSLFLTKTLNRNIFDKEYFIANFTSSDKNEKFVSTTWYKKPALPLLETFYLNLDEVPLKLDNLNSYDMFTCVNKKNSVLSIDELNSPRLPFQKTLWTTKTTNSNQHIKKLNYRDFVIKSDDFKEQIPAVGQLNTSKISNKVRSTSGVIEKQSSWFLQKALKKSKFYSLSLFSTSDDINTVEGVLADLEQVLEVCFSFSRRMSGYSYPDMNSKQVSNFLIQNLFYYFPKTFGLVDTTYNSLKIIFPANPAFINQYFFLNPKIPTKVSIKTAPLKLKDWDNNKPIYNDISVVCNPKTGLDWEFEKTENFEKSNLRFWFENYLSPTNPLTHSKETILKEKFFPQDFLIYDDYGTFDWENGVVPFLTQTEWKNIYNQNKMLDPAEAIYTVNGIALPTIEVVLPDSKYRYARLNFSLNSTLDYLYSPQIFTTKIKSLPSFAGEFFNENFSPVQYKKIMSIFDKPQLSQKTFSESWEPLTFSSWLIVSQIGLAFLFFNFFKYVMSDYFQEFIGFIIDIGMSLGIFDDNIKEQIELITGRRHKGFRIISEPKKKFQDIAGIKSLLPEIAEIVWFLRNGGKEFSLTKNIPRGLLLIGPPGTGKTVLVQAIGGESQVPVLVLSGSSLIAPGESGALKLELLFQEARELAPCIVFIDEIDSLAQARKGVMQNPMGGDELFSALQPVNQSPDLETTGASAYALGKSTSKGFLERSQTSFFQKTEKIEIVGRNSIEFGEDLDSSSALPMGSTSSMKKGLEIQQKMEAQAKSQQQKLSLLVQLLIELDGIHGRKGVVIIGATNRPELLDPAVLRPGRFDKILELGLPNYEKRFEIFKLYGGVLGCEDPNISWEYLSKRTIGFTAGDITSIMNQSALKAILSDTKHTLNTIEHGIDVITTFEIEKPSKKVTPLFINRVAYYQAGKIALSTILEHHPSTVVSYLWPRRQNHRSLQILTNLQKYFFRFARRCEVEHRIIGSYGGKAAEILFLLNSHVSISTFGLEDLNFAFVLVCFTVEKWYLYSKATLISQLTQILSNKNSKELIPEKIELLRELAYFMELPPDVLYSQQTDTLTHPLSQNFFSNPWWQLHISRELEFLERNFSDWYRLYLPNPEETQLNIEWSPPDEFYHGNLLNKQIITTSCITWNDLYNVVRDYQVHSVVLDSFNKALSLLDQNREYLDKLVFKLLKKEVLREEEIDKLSAHFILFPKASLVPKALLLETEPNNQKSSTQEKSTIKIVNNSFGEMSRRKIKNWIDFKDFEIS